MGLAFVARGEDAHDILCADAVANELQAVDAVERIDQCLRRDRALPRRDVGHARAHGEELGGNRDRNASADTFPKDD
jgi:hypothetical protein